MPLAHKLLRYGCWNRYIPPRHTSRNFYQVWLWTVVYRGCSPRLGHGIKPQKHHHDCHHRPFHTAEWHQRHNGRSSYHGAGGVVNFRLTQKSAQTAGDSHGQLQPVYLFPMCSLLPFVPFLLPPLVPLSPLVNSSRSQQTGPPIQSLSSCFTMHGNR